MKKNRDESNWYPGKYINSTIEYYLGRSTEESEYIKPLNEEINLKLCGIMSYFIYKWPQKIDKNINQEYFKQHSSTDIDELDKDEHWTSFCSESFTPVVYYDSSNDNLSYLFYSSDESRPIYLGTYQVLLHIVSKVYV